MRRPSQAGLEQGPLGVLSPGDQRLFRGDRSRGIILGVRQRADHRGQGKPVANPRQCVDRVNAHRGVGVLQRSDERGNGGIAQGDEACFRIHSPALVRGGEAGDQNLWAYLFAHRRLFLVAKLSSVL